MPTIIRLAKTTGELNDVLSTRYRALKEVGRSLAGLSQLTERVIDHFDIQPTTLNIIAYHSGVPVASFRAVEFNPNESLMSLAFDFHETAAQLKGSCYLLDMLALTKDQHARPLVTQQLLKMVLSLLAHRRVQSAFFICPLGLLSQAEKMGFRKLKDPFHSEMLDQQVCPLVIDIATFFSHLIEGIVDQEIIRFQEVFYSTIFDAGEVLVVEGEKGSTAYLIEEGEVEVLIQKNEGLIPISTIKQGHMIGEVAMVTNEVRTASLVAKTPTCCISFDRREFMKLMYQQPHRSMDIFKIFSKRLSESNRRLAEIKG